MIAYTSNVRGTPVAGAARFLVVLVVLMTLSAGIAVAAPQAELWPRWEAHDPASEQRIDHTDWGAFMDRYLVTDHSSGVNRVRYAEVSDRDRELLNDYVAYLEGVAVSGLNRDEQLAYWLNLYNAATVQLILKDYPVDSIRDIKPNFFASGPWDMEILEVEGVAMTLNDVEHRIIRPIWQDPRIHYVVNCASYGCPNLYPEPLTADNWDDVFDESARDYANHPRGVRFDDDTLVLSSIYDWYQEDFGSSLEGVIEHLVQYVDEETAGRLRGHSGSTRYEYDWSLNEP